MARRKGERRRRAASAGERRWTVPRLPDVRIGAKLGLILLIPVLALLGVSTLRLYETAERALQAREAETLARFGATVGDLVHELQTERAAAAHLLATDSGKELHPGYERQIDKTDRVADRYQDARERLPAMPATLTVLLDRVTGQLEELFDVRDAVLDGETTLYAATLRYRTLIADLAGFRDAGAQLGVNPEAVLESRAVAALTKIKEFVAQEHVVMLRVASLGRLSPALQQDFVATIAGQQEAQLDFANTATAAQFALLQHTAIDGNGVDARRLACP